MNQWNNGFTADVTIENNGANVIVGLQLQWSFAGNQQIVNLWNGALTQSGQSIKVANLSYNNGIGANGGVKPLVSKRPSVAAMSARRPFSSTASLVTRPAAQPYTNGNGNDSRTDQYTNARAANRHCHADTYAAAADIFDGDPNCGAANQYADRDAMLSASGAACQVRYTITSQWPGGFTADVVLNSNGTSTINGWTVACILSLGIRRLPICGMALKRKPAKP